MLLKSFLSRLQIKSQHVPSVHRWMMAGAVEFPATAQILFDENTHGIELSISEVIDGETTTATGAARFNAATGLVEFDSEEDELFFERFEETIRLMQSDESSSQ